MATDLRARLESSLGSNFTIQRELGGGGMSRVFVAAERSLERDVVIKVLSEEYSAGVSADRFRREIQLIARLQHPHIVPLLTAGVADGALYYVMPYRGGESLHARIRREGRLGVDDTVRILRATLDALAFAHAQGVVHRDIKPDNILLESGHAVVADFGVSKALKESGTLTSIGIALGTPTYMSPEQASADPGTDHRSDLYSVGVVAYEMLAGAPPFSGSAHEVIRAHMTDAPVPLRDRRPDIPEALGTLIMRALAKDPAARPSNAAEMIAVLDAIVTSGRTVATPARRRKSMMWRAIAAAAAVLVLAGVVTWRNMRPPVTVGARSMVIAPFSAPGGDPRLVQLGQHLVTTLSAGLDGLGDIRTGDAVSVLSQASARGGMLTVEDASAIARNLGARSVLHGTLVPVGNMVNANATLYESDGSGKVLARVTATAPIDSLTTLTDSLSWRLLREIWRSGNAPTPHMASVMTASSAALRDFLRGEELFMKGSVQAAGEWYQRAAEADTNFLFAHFRYRVARGWMGLAAESTIVNRLRRNHGQLPPRDREYMDLFFTPMGMGELLRTRRAFVDRFPDYSPALVSVADYLIHHSVRAGTDIREAVGPWAAVTSLVPNDQTAANHYAVACFEAFDFDCARDAIDRLRRMSANDSVPGFETVIWLRALGAMLAPDPRKVIDSLVGPIARDSMIVFGHHWVFVLAAPAALLHDDFTRIWEHGWRANRDTWLRLEGRAGWEYMGIMTRAIRGDWSGIDSLSTLLPRVKESVSNESALLRMRIGGEAQGLLPPSPATAALATSIANQRGAGPATRYDALWALAMNALLRRDSALYRETLASMGRDTVIHARLASRSLRAIEAGLAGRRSDAADSLLALEREHGDIGPKVWSAFSVDRLLGAQWLSEKGNHAAADSLLRFTNAFVIMGTADATIPVYALAQLQRSRIAEATGQTRDAVDFARLFVGIFDRAPESHQPLVAEARARIARLSGRETRAP